MQTPALKPTYQISAVFLFLFCFPVFLSGPAPPPRALATAVLGAGLGGIGTRGGVLAQRDEIGVGLGAEQHWVLLVFTLQPGCLFCARASPAAFGGGVDLQIKLSPVTGRLRVHLPMNLHVYLCTHVLSCAPGARSYGGPVPLPAQLLQALSYWGAH